MPHYICRTCGTQFAETPEPPPGCPVCLDERQYVPPEGQRWTTLAELRKDHKLRWKEQGAFTGIGSAPNFGIGQRALLVETREGNVLWDCVSLLDEDGLRRVRERGGLAAVAISHPHYYTTMVEWSEAFGDVPIYLHADDARWIMRPDQRIVAWKGERQALLPGLTLVRCGGHFEGGTVLHVESGNGPGSLLTGDVIQVVADRKHVSFMYSFPNYVPLNAKAIRRIAAAVEPFDFDAIYGAWWEYMILKDAKAALAASVERYLKAIG
jgi:glyoxylase-like metal-dependent hydrolase (beta-lactamase superfamily II)